MIHHVSSRAQEALARRPFAVFLGAFTAAGCALVTVPLMGLPGYELSAGLSLLQGLLGGVVGIVFARKESSSMGWAAASATVVLWASLLPPFVLATLRTWLFSPCDPFASVGFFPLLTLPSGFVAACAGVFVGAVTRRWWSAALLWVALVVGSAVHSAWPVLFGPQVFAYNHLAGFLPGPLYDEELRVPSALVWFRAASVALGVALVTLARRRTPPSLPPWRWQDGVRLGAALLVLGALEWNGVALGFRMNDETLARRLGGLWEDAHLEIHYPAGLPQPEIDRIIEDVRFRHQQLTDFFGTTPPGKVRIWWYRSAAEKRQLVGADRTQFAKPWRREVHVNALGFPHPVLKHELVHAMAGPWGAPPFGATARFFGLLPHIGVIEGFAVAADDPADELTLHEWAAAMKQRGLLPDVRTLLEPQGFYSAPAARAYATAGSFIRWLADAKGKDRLRALYRHGDFAAVYGQPLPALATEWEAFLATVQVDERAAPLAFARFRAGSIFERPCAREVARLSAQAAAEADANPTYALELVARCRALQPEEPGHVLAEARQLARLGRTKEAAALLDAQLERFKDEPALFADAALPRAELALEAGDADTAKRLFTALLERHASPAVERTAHVRLATLALGPRGRRAADAWFHDTKDALRLYLLRDALDESPGEPHLAYLLGRRLTQLGEFPEALRWLEVALAQPLPDSVAQEAARLTLEAAFGARACDRVEAIAQDNRFGSAFSARARDWLARCRFDGGRAP